MKFSNVDNNVLYAINGDIINNRLMKVAQNSMIDVELLPQGLYKGFNCKFKINIWTFTKDERLRHTAGCRLRIRKE